MHQFELLHFFLYFLSKDLKLLFAEENYAKKRQRGELSNPDVCEKERKKLENTKRLNEGKIAKLTEKFELRAEQINQSLQLTEEATDVTTILIQVER